MNTKLFWLFNNIIAKKVTTVRFLMTMNIQDLAAELEQVSLQDEQTLEQFRIRFLGSKNVLKDLYAAIKDIPNEQKRAYGQQVNGLKERAEQLYLEAKTALGQTQKTGHQDDWSKPSEDPKVGAHHPLSLIRKEILSIFKRIGFEVSEGPEIEDDWHNFSALNIPETHPARAMHDTFYFPDQMERDGRKMLLRTHTSPVQIRTMTSQEPPIRIIAPGRVYRSDSDATHTPMFHQVEGLVIDKGIHLGHLKWTLETFLRAYFENDDVTLRLRPSYFPFTEPSVEVDVGFSWVKGKRVLGGTENWMELLGSGMVHPKVLRNCGIDPDVYSGFAFGVGVDRLAMLKYGMDDLRAFFDGDNRWLQHYGFNALDVPTLSGGVGA